MHAALARPALGLSAIVQSIVSGIKHTARVCPAPENNRSVLVLLRPENLVELQRKTVEVSNVKRAKVVVEGIVQESVIYGEVERLLPRACLRWSWPVNGALRALGRRSRRSIGVREQCVLIGGIEIGRKV